MKFIKQGNVEAVMETPSDSDHIIKMRIIICMITTGERRAHEVNWVVTAVMMAKVGDSRIKRDTRIKNTEEGNKANPGSAMVQGR